MTGNTIRLMVGTVLTIADCAVINRIFKKVRETKEAEKTAQGLINYYRLRADQYNRLIFETNLKLENEELDDATTQIYVNNIENWKAAIAELDKEFGIVIK